MTPRSDLVTLTVTFILKNNHFEFVAAVGIHISQTHSVNFNLSMHDLDIIDKGLRPRYHLKVHVSHDVSF